jgi:hypothetical protein
MEYMCIDDSGKQTKRWKGNLRILRKADAVYELAIDGRGTYFHVIAGTHSYGNFICIPNHDVGCELADYSDVFWNRERLSRHLKKADATTVACALPYLKEQ